MTLFDKASIWKNLIKKTPYENAGRLSFDYAIPKPDDQFGKLLRGKQKGIGKVIKQGELYDKAREASEKSGALKQYGVDVSTKEGRLLGSEMDAKANIGKTQEEIDKRGIREEKLKALKRANELLEAIHSQPVIVNNLQNSNPRLPFDVPQNIQGAGLQGQIEENIEDESTDAGYRHRFNALIERGVVRKQGRSYQYKDEDGNWLYMEPQKDKDIWRTQVDMLYYELNKGRPSSDMQKLGISHFTPVKKVVHSMNYKDNGEGTS